MNKIKYDSNKKRARMEACTLLLDGYKILFEVELKNRLFISLSHSYNRNRIILKADDKTLYIYKNGILVKRAAS